MSPAEIAATIITAAVLGLFVFWTTGGRQLKFKTTTKEQTMARGDITIRTAEYRPCYVNGERALFHRWTDSARPVVPRGLEETETEQRYQAYSVRGIVEFENGTVARVWPYEIKFADGGRFEDYCWLREREGSENERAL